MEKAKSTIVNIGWFIVALILIAIVGGALRDRAQRGIETVQTGGDTKQAELNTNRNAFIAGCTEGGDLTESECRCALNELMELYPDLLTNEAIWQRINSEGYSTAEMSKVLPCFPESQGV